MFNRWYRGAIRRIRADVNKLFERVKIQSSKLDKLSRIDARFVPSEIVAKLIKLMNAVEEAVSNAALNSELYYKPAERLAYVFILLQNAESRGGSFKKVFFLRMSVFNFFLPISDY